MILALYILAKLVPNHDFGALYFAKIVVPKHDFGWSFIFFQNFGSES